MTNPLHIPDTGGPREFGRVYPPRPQWLAKQLHEEPLEPDLPIVDTHYHMKDVSDRQYFAEDFIEDMNSGHRIVATVHVEANTAYATRGPEELRCVGETEYVLATIQRDASHPGGSRLATGIVGYADLALGSRVEDVLTAHIEVAGSRFKGIRCATAYDDHPAIVSHSKSLPAAMRSSEFLAGAKVLERMGLTFDAWLFFHQIPELIRLADTCPTLTIVLEHCGGVLGYGPYAGKRDDVYKVWERHLTELSRRPNVVAKIGGGMLMRTAAQDYLNVEVPESSTVFARCLDPYVSRSIELFGAERCMFESNFPVDKVVTNYSVLWNAFKRITASATPEQKQALYEGTARRVYKL